MELHCDTHSQIVKNDSLLSNIKLQGNCKIENSYQRDENSKKQTRSAIQPIKATSKIINSSQIQLKKRPRDSSHNTFHVFPTYRLGVFLKKINFGIQQFGINECIKTNSIFNSSFIFYEKEPKQKNYELKSNFSGRKYILTTNGQITFTLTFDFDCSLTYKIRKYYAYTLKPEFKYTDLIGSQNQDDLEILFGKHDNSKKINKFQTKDCIFDAQRNAYALNFGNQGNIIGSVQNSILINQNNEEVFKMYKIQDEVFEVNYSNKFSNEFALAICLASLDFKWLIE